MKFSLYILAISILILISDIIQNSWIKSSVRRIFIVRDKSSLYDLLWFVFSLTGIINYLVFIVSFGLVYFIPKYIHYIPPTCHWSMVLQFLFTGVTNEFMFYWTHRMMHKWFWFAHKLHHSATSFNGITVFRTHPIEVALSSPLLLLPASLIGVSSKVIGVWTLVRLTHDILIHTEIKFLPKWISEWIIIDGKQHAHHHSNNPVDYNCKFATVPVFDKVFGTWKELPDKIVLGI